MNCRMQGIQKPRMTALFFEISDQRLRLTLTNDHSLSLVNATNHRLEPDGAAITCMIIAHAQIVPQTTRTSHGDPFGGRCAMRFSKGKADQPSHLPDHTFCVADARPVRLQGFDGCVWPVMRVATTELAFTPIRAAQRPGKLKFEGLAPLKPPERRTRPVPQYRNHARRAGCSNNPMAIFSAISAHPARRG
jgi:hypothetical protein